MIIRREAIQAVIHAISETDTRYRLASLQADPARQTVSATNGHVAIRATDRTPFADSDFPNRGEFHGDPMSPVLIDADLAKRMIATLEKRPTIPILACLQLSRNGSESTAMLTATDLEAPRTATIQIKPEEDRFPDLDRIMPKADKAGTVGVLLSVAVLETIIKAAKGFGKANGRDSYPAIRLDVPTLAADRFTGEKAEDGTPVPGDVSSAIRFSMQRDGLEVEGAAMPMRR